MLEKFADDLLKWYDLAARDLLWRQDKDPYKIWVSEIMLQQTRVEAVKPYYERWINRYPDAQALANSSEEEVMRHWQGLGYYARARNLLRGVREVCSSYGGQVPDNKLAIQAIPGIGEYTAGAILSIAYNRAEPAVDGNVLRVFSRLHYISEEISQPNVKKRIMELVRQQIPAERPGDFNQALMELGATVCTPRNPRCSNCPIIEFCMAFQEQQQANLPVKRQKAKVKTIFLAAVIIQRQDKYLLFRRPNKGLLAGMWEFPTVEIEDASAIEANLSKYLQGTAGASLTMGEKLFGLTHLFSHRKWDISFYKGYVSINEEAKTVGETDKIAHCGWFAPSEWPQLCFAGPHQQAVNYLSS